MSLIDGFHQVLDSQLEDYHAPKTDTICGVKIYFKPNPTGVSWEEWSTTLYEWLPKFEEKGWLEGLSVIQIGDNITPGEALGRYNHNGSIDLENETGENKKSVLLAHEIIHHVHITLKEFKDFDGSPENPLVIRKSVNPYAASNIGETVAEIGSLLIHGEEFSDNIIELYNEYDGPQGVKDF